MVWIDDNRSGVTSNVLPFTASILSSGSNAVYSDCSNPPSPLKTDSTITSAAVDIATPNIERMEMMLMKFFFLLDRKYRLAMKKEKLTFSRVIPEEKEEC